MNKNVNKKKKKTFLTSKFKDETIEMLHFYGSIIFYSVGNWTLRKVDQKYLAGSETLCWRRLEKISWNGQGKK